MAGAVLSFGYGKRAPVVDSNVMRLLTRLMGIQFKRSEECLDLLWALVPEEDHDYFNYGLIDLGATVCHYREPKQTSTTERSQASLGCFRGYGFNKKTMIKRNSM